MSLRLEKNKRKIKLWHNVILNWSIQDSVKERKFTCKWSLQREILSLDVAENSYLLCWPVIDDKILTWRYYKKVHDARIISQLRNDVRRDARQGVATCPYLAVREPVVYLLVITKDNPRLVSTLVKVCYLPCDLHALVYSYLAQ